MKKPKTDLYGSGSADADACAKPFGTSCGNSREINEDSFPVISSANQQTEPSTSTSPENATSESASTVQIPSTQESSGGAQPSTPRTPSTPPEHGTNVPNPPTPGNTTSRNLVNPSPSYASVTEGSIGCRSYTSLTPVNPAVDNEEINDDVADNSSYVSYVPAAEHSSSIYAAATSVAAASTTNGQTLSPYPLYTVGDNSVYTPNTTHYYTANTTSPGITYAQESGLAYLVSPTSNNTNIIANTNLEIDGGPNLSHATRVSPATVQWLMDNYETAEGVSLPRSTLYNHYIRHCTEHKLDPVNAASFGKLIRSVFLGLRTRRLGTRGNSKYHYYGIRLKPDSLLNHFVEPLSNHVNANRQTNNLMNSTHMSKRLRTTKSEHFEASQHINGISINEALTIQQYLGDSTRVLDDFPTLEFSFEMPGGITQDDIIIFRSLYREHCEALLEDVVTFQLSDVDRRWRAFWRSGDMSPSCAEASEFENVLPFVKLHSMCRIKDVQRFVRDSDYQFYQNIVGVLLPDVLRPIPSPMTQAIRNFAKTLEGSLAGAMHGFPEEMVLMKLNIVNALAQTLRRYTSLNHLAQAARAVLQNQNQICQMLSDLNRVDFHNVEEQASWVCGCNGDLVPDLEADFKATLGQQQSLEQWATWLEGVVDRILRPHINSPKFVQAARQFMLKWSFYSSLVIRDLTLRSAASFGSFHLLRLLYDEYVFFLVEHRVAQVTGIVPIAVIGKKSFEMSFDPSMDSADEEDGQTESVPKYLTDHRQSPGNSHNHSVVVNGIKSNAPMLSSTVETLEASSSPIDSTPERASSPLHDVVKSEFKQRGKNFIPA